MNIIDKIRFGGYYLGRRLGAGEEGAVATEYVLLVVFIALAAAVGMVFLGQALIDAFTTTGETVEVSPAELPAQPS